jgi:hypothetical protein
MKGVAGVVSLCLAVACGAAFTASPAGADPAAVDPNTACATNFSALRVDGDPNAVVIVADSLAGPFRGTITAYGHETKWTGTIGRAAVTEHYRQPEASFIVRARPDRRRRIHAGVGIMHVSRCHSIARRRRREPPH